MEHIDYGCLSLFHQAQNIFICKGKLIIVTAVGGLVFPLQLGLVASAGTRTFLLPILLLNLQSESFQCK